MAALPPIMTKHSASAIAAAASLLLTQGVAAERPIIKPRALEAGMPVAVTAPARFVNDDAVTTLTLGLRSLEHEPLFTSNVTARWGYLAGTDEERLQGLHESFANSDVAAVFCVTGGYGTTRLLDRIDYDLIRQNPKIISGFSDITALHIAIYQETGLVTFHAPTHWAAVTRREDLRPYSAGIMWQLLTGAPWREDPNRRWMVPLIPDSPTVTISGGTARGRLVGGNLSLVHALMGTPWEINTAGHILFLEEVREAPYRVDRMLSTLRLAGKLDDVAGVVIGQFTLGESDRPGFTNEEIFEQYFAGRPYPVIANFPVGHVELNATLPIGVMAELNGDTGELWLLESPVSFEKDQQD